jgi:PAS domain S-box-containing protein
MVTTAQLQQEVKQLREELDAREVRFRNVITKLGDGIIILDSKGRVCFANQAAECLFKCNAEDLIGKEVFGTRVFEIKGGQIGTEIIQRVGETERKGTRVVQTQVEVLRPDAEDAIAEMRVVETQWEGEPAIIASLRDITSRVRMMEALQRREVQLTQQAQQLEKTLQELKQTQAQLIQTEKMSSLGQMVAGVAHEINNPVNFIYGNLDHANCYIDDLLNLVKLYQTHYPNPEPEIDAYTEEIDLDFLRQDLPKLLSSMQLGTDRIREIVLNLRNFSRLDEAQMKRVNIHDGLESTLLILHNRLKPRAGFPGIEILKEYGELPPIECYAGQLNQVFMNILSNAVDALETKTQSALCGLPSATEKLNGKGEFSRENLPQPEIRISTDIVEGDAQTGDRSGRRVVIRIADNGSGMPEEVRQRLFDPFFTTKPVGKGTGLGLSISYHIVVEKHGGQLHCVSAPDRGTEFIIEIPLQEANRKPADSGASNNTAIRSQARFSQHREAC